MGAEWGPLRLKATDQDRRSNMETSFSVPGTANRLPPSGCHAVPLRLAEVTSTWTHHACHIAHACPSYDYDQQCMCCSVTQQGRHIFWPL